MKPKSMGMMKNSKMNYWSVSLSALAFITAIITPLQFLAPDMIHFFVPINLICSIFFMYDSARDFKNWFRERQGETKTSAFLSLEFWVLAIASLPFELLFLFPNSSKILNLLRLGRVLSIRKTYHLLALDILGLRSLRVPLIFASVVIAIHFAACGWMALNDFPNLGTADAYLRSLYWAITTLTTTGYGDITPTNNAGRVFTIFVMMAGFSAFGLIVGNISNMLMAKNRLREASKEKIDDVAMLMKHYNVPTHLQGDVFKFYHHKMNKRLSENDSMIIADLPHALQNELFVYMKIKLISELPVFSGLSHQCLLKISHALEQVSFLSGETIINKGDSGEEMYIIDHGDVQVLGDQNNTIAMLKHGQCFGEIALLMEVRRTAKVIAISYCDAYKFKKLDFLEICKVHPELERNFHKIIQKRTQPKSAA